MGIECEERRSGRGHIDAVWTDGADSATDEDADEQQETPVHPAANGQPPDSDEHPAELYQHDEANGQAEWNRSIGAAKESLQSHPHAKHTKNASPK